MINSIQVEISHSLSKQSEIGSEASAAAALASATAAATSATQAASSATTAAGSVTAAASSATQASNSAVNSANSAASSSSSANLAAAYALSATDRLVVCTISGTFTVPDEVYWLYLLACAGGGGGGSYFGPGGGGGESCFWLPYAVTPGQIISYTIGAGGPGSTTLLTNATSTTGNFSGTIGGNTTFGTLTLHGGYPGFCDGSAEYPGAPGGLGGTQGRGMSPHIDLRDASHNGITYYNGGDGGSCASLGVGGSGGFWSAFGNDTTKTAGGNGQGFGAGGGGGAIKLDFSSGVLHTTCLKGGNGASGIVIIRF